MAKTKISATQEPFFSKHKGALWSLIILSVLVGMGFGLREVGFFNSENLNTDTNLAENPSVADNAALDSGNGTCPATSCDTGDCCCTREVHSGLEVNKGFVVCRMRETVYTPSSCDCPSDTHYMGTMDIQGITFKDCACNECPASCSN